MQASPSHCTSVSCICTHVLSVLFQPWLGQTDAFIRKRPSLIKLNVGMLEAFKASGELEDEAGL